MKVELEAIVIRVKGEAVAAEGINDCYTHVQLFLKNEWLENVGVEFWKTAAKTSWWEVQENGIYLGEQEAKDQYLLLDDIQISIEKIGVEL
jgi:hypothetical protein